MEGTPITELDWKRQGAFTAFGFFYLVRRICTPALVPAASTWHLTPRVAICVPRVIPLVAAQGAFQYFFYTRILTPFTEPVTRVMGHIASSPIKVFLDQGIHHPLLYFPTFYYIKYVLVQGQQSDEAFKMYKEELWPNCQALWKIWVPGQVRNIRVLGIGICCCA